jgi:hypothetical protein
MSRDDAPDPRALVPVGPQARRRAAGPKVTPEVAAQMLGQSGQRRGLKGGPEVLDEARTSYLETEWSGPDDRRTPTGGLKRIKV